MNLEGVRVRREIGARIRCIRESKGMTLASLSHATGIATVTIGSWERGERGVPVDRLLVVAAALRTHPGAFLSDDSPEAALDRLKAALVEVRAAVTAAAGAVRSAKRLARCG